MQSRETKNTQEGIDETSNTIDWSCPCLMEKRRQIGYLEWKGISK